MIALLLLAELPGVAGEAGRLIPEAFSMETIHLPVPRLDSQVSVERALQQRRSVRAFSPAPLTLAEIGQLLWAAQGITRPEGLRTAPSAGALYPLELMLVAGNVTGLAAGVYHYLPTGHALAPVVPGEQRDALAHAARDQSWIGLAPAVIVVTAVERRTSQKYGSKGMAYIYIEVGHAAQNVFLEAQALGLAAAAVGAFDETPVSSLLRLPRGQVPLYLVPVGKPAGH